MCASTDDLWGSLPIAPAQRAPIAILREQGVLLGRNTKNLLLGRVRAERDIVFSSLPPSRTGMKEPSFFYSFYLVAPTLDNYAVKLFTIGHGIELYPVIFNFPDGGDPVAADTEQEFIQRLRQIFTSDSTKRVIESLLSQSQVLV
ncbi:MAG: hypothetical protein FJ291_24155 [Planctomycetes bacterium]|nr:hypothetical protein [Planctomycetota bacterium]